MKEKILIVDDTRATRELLSDVFSDRFEIDMACDGRQAIEKFQLNRYSVILTDVHMPVLDGISATRFIRSIEADHPERDRAAIIALTADVLGSAREKCLAAGADAFLSKPIDLQELGALVEVLSKSSEFPIPCYSLKNCKSVSPCATFDISAALSRLQGDEKILRSLIEFFMEDHVEVLERIERSTTDRDTGAVFQAAHTLQGMAAGIGAEEVVQIAETIRIAAKQNSILKVAGELHELGDAVSRLLVDLKDYQRAS